MPQDFFTLGSLATFAGLVLAVYLIVLFSKSFLKYLVSLVSKTILDGDLGDFVIQLYAAVVALLIMLLVVQVQGVGLALINAVLVALAATGLHETIKRPIVAGQKASLVDSAAEIATSNASTVPTSTETASPPATPAQTNQ